MRPDLKVGTRVMVWGRIKAGSTKNGSRKMKLRSELYMRFQ